jgi:predicted CXXCH cytochrome family protein
MKASLHIFLWALLAAAVWTVAAAPPAPIATSAGPAGNDSPTLGPAAPATPVPPHTLIYPPATQSTTAPATAPLHLRAHLLRPEPLPVRMVPPDPNSGHVARPVVAIANDSCVTSECHSTVRSYPVVHGPVNVNSCDACHKLVDAKAHHFEPRRAKAELCTFCHQARKPYDAFVHKPVETGDCTGCHNPHGGKDKRFLIANTMAEVCARCHDDSIFNKKFVHGPAALGACEACHQPHSSKFPKLVNAQGADFCYACHDQMKAQMVSAKFVHKAVTEKGCNECHDVHASNYPKQLKMATQDLCVSCHKPIQQVILTASVKHSAVSMKDGCMNCHTPHGGDRAKLMKSDPAGACLSCHDNAIKVTDTRTVPSMAFLKEPGLSKHGPLRDGDCTGCHAPHGGPVSRLLAKPFPDTFYTAFDVEKYSLCFSCHDKQLVLMKNTNALTRFRNGDQNLHFVHVNKADKGRTCRACHEMHASRLPDHLRESVPFGNWQMPLSFNQTPTGGSCRPGCHTEMKYDRNTPVQNKLLLPPAAASR